MWNSYLNVLLPYSVGLGQGLLRPRAVIELFIPPPSEKNQSAISTYGGEPHSGGRLLWCVTTSVTTSVSCTLVTYPVQEIQIRSLYFLSKDKGLEQTWRDLELDPTLQHSLLDYVQYIILESEMIIGTVSRKYASYLS